MAPGVVNGQVWGCDDVRWDGLTTRTPVYGVRLRGPIQGTRPESTGHPVRLVTPAPFRPPPRGPTPSNRVLSGPGLWAVEPRVRLGRRRLLSVARGAPTGFTSVRRLVCTVALVTHTPLPPSRRPPLRL